ESRLVGINSTGSPSHSTASLTVMSPGTAASVTWTTTMVRPDSVVQPDRVELTYYLWSPAVSTPPSKEVPVPTAVPDSSYHWYVSPASGLSIVSVVVPPSQVARISSTKPST